MIVKMDVLAYEEARLLIGLKFDAIDAFCFEHGKEILSQSIVIRITTS